MSNIIEYKKTQIGQIPKDWKVVKLKDIAEINAGGNAPQGEKYFENGKYPFIRVQHFNGNKRYVDKWDLINDKAVKDYKLKLFPRDAIIFPKSGASINLEKRAMLPFNAYLVNHLCVVIPNNKVVNSIYLFYLLKRVKLSKGLAGTTLPYLNLSYISNVLVPLPSFSEQQKIAEILSTVDEAIQKVDLVIQKTERLKKGLMQELLTKGIGHKEFKNTEIGKIPKDWKVVRLGDRSIAEIRSNKSVRGKDKIAFIPMELVPNLDLYANFEMRDQKDVKSYTYCLPGDLLLAKITPSLENGKQGIVPDNVPGGFALATTEVFPIVCKGIDCFFLFYILKFSKFRKVLEYSMRGTTGRQRVPKNAVEMLKIPYPSIEEQQNIAQTLLTIDKKLELERKRKQKLEVIKKGLMNDLLTGKVRVKVKNGVGNAH